MVSQCCFCSAILPIPVGLLKHSWHFRCSEGAGGWEGCFLKHQLLESREGKCSTPLFSYKKHTAFLVAEWSSKAQETQSILVWGDGGGSRTVPLILGEERLSHRIRAPGIGCSEKVSLPAYDCRNVQVANSKSKHFEYNFHVDFSATALSTPAPPGPVLFFVSFLLPAPQWWQTAKHFPRVRNPHKNHLLQVLSDKTVSELWGLSLYF